MAPKSEVPSKAVVWRSPTVQGAVGLLAGWVLTLLPISIGCAQVGSMHSYGAHSQAQVAMAIALCSVAAAWLVVDVCLFCSLCGAEDKQSNGYGENSDVELAVKPEAIGARQREKSPSQADKPNGGNEEASESKDVEDVGLVTGSQKTLMEGADTLAFLKDIQKTLRTCAEFTAILLVLYLCDRTDIIPTAKKTYDPKQFWGLWGLICGAAFVSMKTLKDAKPLQREQTDEWKGWMQIMFLMYHYFEEKEVYNAIRIYIAAYVWMTGYGNYSLYVRGKSFTTRRTLQMLFRLNFLVFFVCVLLNNEYMLYYIAPMHTLFTVFVILVLYIKQSFNESTCYVYVKLVLTILFTIALYDGPDFIFRGIFGTAPVVHPLLAFHDPLHPEVKDEMHEWHFRSGLDRFIWVIGMLTAVHFPDFAVFLTWVESQSTLKMNAIRVGLLAAAFAILGGWYYFAFSLAKYAYNVRHPFTSFIPITLWLLLRNFLPAMRQRYLFLFAYLGRVTLETYILQFHVWMKTTGPNGSPKLLLAPIQGSYWLNFALMTSVYLFLSIRLFHITVALRDAFLPDDMRMIGIHCGATVAVAAISWVLATMFMA